MDFLDTGEFDLGLSGQEPAVSQALTPALVVDVVEHDPPELDEGDFVFMGWQEGI